MKQINLTAALSVRLYTLPTLTKLGNFEKTPEYAPVISGEVLLLPRDEDLRKTSKRGKTQSTK